MRPRWTHALSPAALSAALLLTQTVRAADRYQETRELRVDAAGASFADIDIGAGSLEILGDEGAREVRLSATIWVEDRPSDTERVRAALEEHVDLVLERRGDRIRVVTETRDPGLGYSLPHVDLRLVLPRRIDVELEDRSGWIRIEGIAGDVEIRDGSGSLELVDIDGHVAIDDASGSIDVTGIGGRLGIEDDSGSIGVRQVAGDIAIDDGSGSITVRDVEGSVTIRDGSGSILVAGVGRDLHVLESGSGSVSFVDVAGEITVED